jgi:assimilatory nitrate reductase catalytic subunit
MHWNDQFAAKALVDGLVPARTDPHSGQPASKHVPVRVERFAAALYGFAVLRERPRGFAADYWALAKCQDGWRCELAFADPNLDGAAFFTALIGCSGGDRLAYTDPEARQQRFAHFEGERLVGALFFAPEPVAVSRSWAVEQLGNAFANGRARLAVIAGRPGRDLEDRGATVCSCFGVGSNQIAAAVQAGCCSVAAIGERLQAGTNCGSCQVEIKAIINAHRSQAAE